MIKVVKFYADWCGPCKSFAPVYEEIQEDYSDFEFGEVNIDSAPFTTTEYQVTTVPTVMVIKDGTVAERISGIIPKHKLRDFLDTYK